MTTARAKQLVNLLARGRTLHYGNARKLISLPAAAPPTAELVYRAMQVTVAFLLMERRGYLTAEEHDAFTDAVFGALAGPNGDRMMRLVEGYAAAFANPQTFIAKTARDLSAGLCGEVRDDLVRALAGTPPAVVKMTEFYVAQVFGDTELMRQHS